MIILIKCQYVCEQYRNLSEEEKTKMVNMFMKDMENLPKDEKQRLVEYGKIYSRMQNANEDYLILLLMITYSCIKWKKY